MGIKFDDRILVVVATAPAGLGHIRVTNALQQGLSSKTRLEVMGISDPGMQWIHRLTSRNATLKKVMEFTQENRVAEQLFSGNYRKWLRTHADAAAKQLIKIVANAWPQPEVVVVLATHFGLAHQLAAQKGLLQRKLGSKLILAVVVTDDSPQEMWAVSGADVVFVPSNTTREVLLSRLMEIGGDVPEVITIPYPISPLLGERLSTEEYENRIKQARGKHSKIVIPVSGAAVQLSYFQDLIGTLTADGLESIVVSRESPYTHAFLQWCQERDGVEVVAHEYDPDVVAAYDDVYMGDVIGMEVTKPSEQAFKALFSPLQRGGAILLFSSPVGRQEKDNLSFLRRHRLIPSVDDQARINEWCLKGNRLHLTPELLSRARHWRGVVLPDDGMWSGVAIKRLIEGGIVAAMADFGGFLEGHDEIRSDGVKEIWQKLEWLTRIR
jgi:hypothetical protein